MTDVTIAIPTYESDPELLRRVLHAVIAQAEHPALVVDMSRSQCVEQVTAAVDRIDLVRLPGSRGVAQSRNEAVRRAATRYVLFLDSDAVPAPGWSAAMARGFDEDRVAIVGARVIAAWEREPSRLLRSATAADWLSMFDLGDTPMEVPRVMGTSYAIDRERLGDAPFDESLGRAPGVPLGHEEVRLALEAQAGGWRCWYAAGAVVRHHIPRSRATWPAMLRRAFVAGQETRLEVSRLEPLPRRMTLGDHAFRALMAPSFVLGRAIGPR